MRQRLKKARGGDRWGAKKMVMDWGERKVEEGMHIRFRKDGEKKKG
jgi:hypothetical protein